MSFSADTWAFSGSQPSSGLLTTKKLPKKPVVCRNGAIQLNLGRPAALDRRIGEHCKPPGPVAKRREPDHNQRTLAKRLVLARQIRPAAVLGRWLAHAGQLNPWNTIEYPRITKMRNDAKIDYKPKQQI